MSILILIIWMFPFWATLTHSLAADFDSHSFFRSFSLPISDSVHSSAPYIISGLYYFVLFQFSSFNTEFPAVACTHTHTHTLNLGYNQRWLRLMCGHLRGQDISILCQIQRPPHPFHRSHPPLLYLTLSDYFWRRQCSPPSFACASPFLVHPSVAIDSYTDHLTDIWLYFNTFSLVYSFLFLLVLVQVSPEVLPSSPVLALSFLIKF